MARSDLTTDDRGEEEIEDLKLEGDDLLEQGNIEEAESFYEEALELYNQAMEIYKRIGRTKGIIEAHQKIGTVYTNILTKEENQPQEILTLMMIGITNKDFKKWSNSGQMLFILSGQITYYQARN